MFTAAAAQAQAPAHWRVVKEEGTSANAAVEFVAMPPGWHITTGPTTLLFDPRRILENNFTLTTELFLFPESSRDGYGIFIGGDSLGSGGSRYIALQLRRDGSASVIQRRGTVLTTLTDWKLISAVGPHPGKDTQRITMSITLDSTSVLFTANGAEVARLPRGSLSLAGQFGFRMGTGINIHVVRLDVAEQLAPPRRR
jgi:hypothetical protein